MIFYSTMIICKVIISGNHGFSSQRNVRIVGYDSVTNRKAKVSIRQMSLFPRNKMYESFMSSDLATVGITLISARVLWLLTRVQNVL